MLKTKCLKITLIKINKYSLQYILNIETTQVKFQYFLQTLLHICYT